MEKGGVDSVIYKNHYAEDKRIIFKELSHLLSKYDLLSQFVEPPEFTVSGSYIKTTAKVLLNGGLGWIGFGKIIEECNQYPGKAWLKRTDSENKVLCKGKNCLELVKLCVNEGDNVTIFVEGEGEEAQKLARYLYSILTSRYIFNVDYKRFEK